MQLAPPCHARPAAPRPLSPSLLRGVSTLVAAAMEPKPLGRQVEEESLEEQIRHVQLFAAEMVASMELTRADVLRCVPACVPLERCARAFRATDSHADWYQRSAMCESVAAFWSHSWHGERWKKIITLMVLYNGPAAICSGSSTQSADPHIAL